MYVTSLWDISQLTNIIIISRFTPSYTCRRLFSLHTVSMCMVYYVDERTARILVRSAGAQRCCDHVCLHIIHSVCCVSLCLCVCLRTSSITSTRTNITTFLYTISHKNHASLFLSITLAYLERFFLPFLYQWKQQWILYSYLDQLSLASLRGR